MQVDGKKLEALIVIFIGIGVLAVSLLADVIGIANAPGFGSQQTMGTILGVVIIVGGVILARQRWPFTGAP